MISWIGRSFRMAFPFNRTIFIILSISILLIITAYYQLYLFHIALWTRSRGFIVDKNAVTLCCNYYAACALRLSRRQIVNSR